MGLEEEDDDDKRRSESEKEVDRSSYHQPSAIKSRQETARSTNTANILSSFAADEPPES